MTRDMQARGRGAALGVATLALALALLPASATPSERSAGLLALPRVALDVVVSPGHPDLTADELRSHVVRALGRAPAAPVVDMASPERLRVLVTVRSHTSSDLRGYYLPLSQAYGIGPVRLTVERPAAVAGLPAPVPAVVWQSERLARGPMARSAPEILALVDEMLQVFLEDYREALQK